MAKHGILLTPQDIKLTEGISLKKNGLQFALAKYVTLKILLSFSELQSALLFIEIM